ncbi:MAG TPA: PASTA domain-containing protein [Arachnia sp.]|nr:PASTA domain-containing protein [Arachnia sp.]HMT85374.1 PASTA domain-containing protein [Arachnia sp.]
MSQHSISASAPRTRRCPLLTALLLAVALISAACTPPVPGTTTPTETTDGAQTTAASLLLLGIPTFTFEDFTLDLEELGYAVATNTDDVPPETDLVLVVVDARDGLMRKTVDALEALEGETLPRVAVALIAENELDDNEIETLILREVVEVLATHDVTPIDADNVVHSPGDDLTAALQVHLRRPPRNYVPIVPIITPPTFPATVRVEHFAGVPLNDALKLLAEQGLVGEAIADPDIGVVSECDPGVFDQVPAAGTVLPSGGVVGLIVHAPDRVDPQMAGCLLPEFTRAEVDARIAEIDAQPRA